ncbi:AI-2E family transporter [Frankia sp. CN7]|uniref:AI-2E family transporter n=1 Tax=Frankia nepalensis TaxID=1836974 RepID=A0A937R666_9ACTN|nr:AI-2E family transporter [Frankia nepalensis]MBL7516282.1 AI-2E family transporter [Frankia nepalensis]MBL7625971.1 AI-2E family transporter [Frankia nepalensis]
MAGGAGGDGAGGDGAAAGGDAAAARRAAAKADGGSARERAERSVPLALRISAGWSWRLLVTAAAVYVVVVAIGRIRSVVIPVLAGLLISALIVPIAQRLQRMGVPRLASAFIALLAFFIFVGGAAVGVGFNAANELPKVTEQVSQGIDKVRDYLATGPLHLSDRQIDDLVDSVQHSLTENRGRVLSGVITTASVLFEVIAGILVTLFATFFFIYDGAGIWNWIVTRFPPGAEERVRGAGREAWATLTGYIRGTVFVAIVDALGISIGLIAVGTPLVAPLALLTFFGGFIPIVGATLAGAAAVLVTLVAKGVVPAVIVLGVVLAVQQIEGHLLQPLVMRRAVNLHPLAIVIALSAGGVLAGIPGAIAAVPTVAIINRVAKYLAATGKPPPDEKVDPGGVG